MRPQKNYKKSDRDRTFNDYWSYLFKLKEIESFVERSELTGQKYKAQRKDNKAIVELMDKGKWVKKSFVLYSDKPAPSSCEHTKIQQCKTCGKIFPINQEKSHPHC